MNAQKNLQGIIDHTLEADLIMTHGANFQGEILG
jgi:hypothetical protein